MPASLLMPATKYTAVKAESHLASKAKFIADKLDRTIGEYISDLIRKQVEADYERLIKEEVKRLTNKPKD